MLLGKSSHAVYGADAQTNPGERGPDSSGEHDPVFPDLSVMFLTLWTASRLFSYLKDTSIDFLRWLSTLRPTARSSMISPSLLRRMKLYRTPDSKISVRRGQDSSAEYDPMCVGYTGIDHEGAGTSHHK